MPHLITPEKLKSVQFHVADPTDIYRSLQVGEKYTLDFKRVLTANILVTAGSDVNSEQVFLSDVVCSYRATADEKYYRDYITVGIPDLVWDKIVLAAKQQRGFSVDTQIKPRWNDGYWWLEVSMRDKKSPFYIVVEENDQTVKCAVNDVRYFFDNLKKSLLTKMLCTMRIEKQYVLKDRYDTVLWSLGITPVEIYIESTSSNRDRQKVVDLSLCLVDANIKDTFMQLMEGLPKGSRDSSSEGDEEEEEEDTEEEEEKASNWRKRQRTRIKKEDDGKPKCAK